MSSSTSIHVHMTYVTEPGLIWSWHLACLAAGNRYFDNHENWENDEISSVIPRSNRWQTGTGYYYDQSEPRKTYQDNLETRKDLNHPERTLFLCTTWHLNCCAWDSGPLWWLKSSTTTVFALAEYTHCDVILKPKTDLCAARDGYF